MLMNRVGAMLALGQGECATGGQEEIETLLADVGILTRLRRPKRFWMSAEAVHGAGDIGDQIITQPHRVHKKTIGRMPENSGIRVGGQIHGGECGTNEKNCPVS
jgi:hypothetical protein